MRALATADRDYGFYYSPGYEELIASFEYKELYSATLDQYQGDIVYVLQEPQGRVGFLMFGYGSCSGCDALEGCESMEEVYTLRDSLYNDIYWCPSLEALQEDMKNNERWVTQFWSYHLESDRDNDYKRAFNDILNLKV